jgi:class 3 adenylate cyclase/CHASE2 domain-containing sensor protein
MKLAIPRLTSRRGRLRNGASLLAVALIWSLLALLGIENLSLLNRSDQFVRDWEIASVFAPREAQDPQIIIVAVDEPTLSRFAYRSPVDRAFLSNLLQSLSAHQPAAIGMDFVLDQPTEPAKDDALKRTMATIKVPLVVSYIASPETESPEQIAFENAMVPSGQRGLANLPTDQFDTAREVFPGAKLADGRFAPGLARALAAAVGVTTPAVQVPIIWRGRPPATDTDPDPKPFRQVSATVAGFMPDSWFRDKIVLIGSDVTLVDRHRTPFSSVLQGDAGQLPGIVIQAHSLSQLLHQKVSPVANWWLDFSVTLLFALLGAALGVTTGPLSARLLAVLGLIVLLWVGGVFIFHYADVMVGLLAPILSLIATFGSVDSLGGREARKQRAFIQGAFSRYVSPKVVEQMVADPTRMSLEGERREMTFLFSDIADFTNMSEKLEAGELARLLNGYLDGMTNIVLKHGGMVDKFIGDAVFAIFNAPIDLPDHAEKAVRCMLEMDDFGQAYRRQQKAAGVALGITRIGVHTGVAVIGNFGSHARFTYTASGDAVNTAARLEGINKYLGTRLCVSGATRALCKGIGFRSVASAVLKGKSEALELWEPLHDTAVSSEFLSAYEAAYDRLRRGQPEAVTMFAALLETQPDDPCVLLHVERMRQGMTGVDMVMTEK